MYTYVHRQVCKKENTGTYGHTGRVSNAYSHIRTARARVHGWVGTEKLRRRVHGEATECVVFIGRQRNAWEPTGLDRTTDGNEAWRTTERRKLPCVRPAMVETGSCSSRGVWRTAKWRKRTSYGRNEGPIEKIIDSINAPGPLTCSRATQLTNFCGHFAFVSISEPKKVDEAFMEPEWIQAMQEELQQFELNNVWELVKRPDPRSTI